MVTKDKILTVNGATTQKKRIIGPSTRFWADDMKGTFWPYVAMLGLAVICPIDENRHFKKNIQYQNWHFRPQLAHKCFPIKKGVLLVFWCGGNKNFWTILFADYPSHGNEPELEAKK